VFGSTTFLFEYVLSFWMYWTIYETKQLFWDIKHLREIVIYWYFYIL